ncbi:hypothetical protein LEP1GSC137_3928 [Leptospira borgpetersenii str. Noumea 25]|uniref:Uncharacterized protein n=2 Tax=Leptospira borgpetersenii TaxID=174 RepID=A0A0E3B2B5_LEPBO|nr:hypothetical protein LBBP_02724 [Leptospira borgpetersenii serovar Ballum]EKP15240.1 hypothetical protein LEP1GSC128_2232 [Leptospira borgpetersenii str. 200801926]EKQ90008.1 hypothetical protein LEP1GSC101_2060 [Leptospira borgpetersenii str. UI 09149]EKQ99017.1 hypothetical protein LEP1GSC121_2698 [Leptospira borgpetersenii serovar Castellonis str. 200801910]EMK12740.1 hypothetical protein LEP1GSC066_3717 [Leptospira sp. serovar Kenya str. Sh9]EMO10820.1 hypothetical protein LEP1GSC137_39
MKKKRYFKPKKIEIESLKIVFVKKSGVWEIEIHFWNENKPIQKTFEKGKFSNHHASLFL